jgi:hypothetical protein
MDMDAAYQGTLYSRLKELAQDEDVGEEVQRLLAAEVKLNNLKAILMRGDKNQGLDDAKMQLVLSDTSLGWMGI